MIPTIHFPVKKASTSSKRYRISFNTLKWFSENAVGSNSRASMTVRGPSWMCKRLLGLMESILAACLLQLMLGSVSQASAEECADLALVLAVDTSSSINAEEFSLQTQAIVSAFRSEDVLKVISQAGTVDISIMYWADPGMAVQETGFYRVRGPSDVERLVTAVNKMQRQTFGNTGLSTGLNAALDRLAAAGCAHRYVINVSGDGRETIVPRKRAPHPGLEAVRSRAVAANVTINALVLPDEPNLADYFERSVIVGPGSFVMEVAGFREYEDALRRKLVREISPLALTQN